MVRLENPSDHLIEVSSISKSYGENKVLNDLSINVDKGEIVALIGSSGCGKSTLVRCISGLERIDSGSIKISGESVISVKDVVGKLGMVFQNFNLFPHYTVMENITKPLSIVSKMDEKFAYEKGLEILKKVRLEDKADDYPKTLSGGQKQRVAIARAMAMSPEILIFDEPTSSLDPELSHEVFYTIRELAKEGQTMIIVTHQINAIKSFATRVVFLNNGEVQVDSDPDMVFNHTEDIGDSDLTRFLNMVDFEDLDE